MYEIIGIRPVDFTSKEGNHITGYTIFIAGEDDHTRGRYTDKFFMSAQKWDNLPYIFDVGDRINLLYNRYGKVQTIEQA